MGDLNFRLIEGTYNFDQISEHLERGEFSVLLAQDQLKQVQRERQAFSELHETEPEFPPTYKFKVGQEVYSAK